MMNFSVWKVFSVALLVRLVFIVLGDRLDKRSGGLQYTDIDYHVFSDAADLVRYGLSPYERATYRYPPLLALLLVPNHIWPSFGKALFSTADASIIFELHSLLDAVDPQHTMFYCWLWAFNFASINICTRGSSDSITNYLVLLSLRLILSAKSNPSIISSAGLVLGLLIYLRVYPVIYLPAYVFFIAMSSAGEKKGCTTLQRLLKGAWSTLTLVSSTVFTLTVLTYTSYYYYGQDYLENAVLYHLSREDHRHNFSMHFYGIYLAKASTESYAQQLVNQLTKYIPSSMQNTCNSLAISNFNTIFTRLSLVVDTCVYYLPSVVLFLPQIILFCAIIVTFAPTHLPLCLLLQTMVFVSYNKVITAQYFSWYMCLLPVCMRSLRCIPVYTMLIVSVFWCAALAFWLYNAYLLEFLGLNHFYDVWVASLVFHIANTIAIGVVILYAPK